MPHRLQVAQKQKKPNATNITPGTISPRPQSANLNRGTKRKNPSPEEINEAITFYNKRHPHKPALPTFQATPFELYEEAFDAGYNARNSTHQN